jgi:predicted CopG family antitoxin
MKRITISIDDEIYASLVDYAADTCKEDLARLSLSRAIRKLLSKQLAELNYYPMHANRQQEIRLQQIMRSREKNSHSKETADASEAHALY